MHITISPHLILLDFITSEQIMKLLSMQFFPEMPMHSLTTSLETSMEDEGSLPLCRFFMWQ